MPQWLGSMPTPDPDFDDTGAGDARPRGRSGRPTPPGAGQPPSSGLPGTPSPPPAGAAGPGLVDDGQVRVALWGASGSGKSTYLWALPRALHRTARSRDGWTITPMDDTSRGYLADAENGLVVDRVLPQGTASSLSLRWMLARSSGGLLPSRRRAGRILLTVEDRPGGDYRQALEAAVSQLAEAEAVVYLYDPVSDARDRSETFAAFSSTLRALSSTMLAQGTLRPDGRLPQHLAVCVTKFDDPAIFDRACRGRWATQDSGKPYLPRIADRYAYDFFVDLCRATGGTGDEVRRLIESSFLPQRVRYYVTSSVGFNLDHNDEFDADDYANLDHEPASGQESGRVGSDLAARYRERLRSIPVPVNVLEPLVDLNEMVRRDREQVWYRPRFGGGTGRRP